MIWRIKEGFINSSKYSILCAQGTQEKKMEKKRHDDDDDSFLMNQLRMSH